MGLKGRSCDNAQQMDWRVIYVSSRQEKKVTEMLLRLKIQHYLPLVKTLRQWSDRKKWVELPLFHGYVFVRPENARRDEVLQIPGVVKYLQYNGKDAIATNAEIETIMAIIQNGYDVAEHDFNASFEPGDVVSISQGPLKGYQGEFLRFGGDDYAIVHFETLGRAMRVKLPKQLVKKIDG